MTVIQGPMDSGLERAVDTLENRHRGRAIIFISPSTTRPSRGRFRHLYASADVAWFCIGVDPLSDV